MTEVVDVAEQFRFMTVLYLIQALVAFVCSFYQVCAIYFCKSLLKYRLYVSRINKLAIGFFIIILIMTHFYRLSETGKICSGDYLSHQERQEEFYKNDYLIRMGNILLGYMIGMWTVIALGILIVIVFGALVFAAFS